MLVSHLKSGLVKYNKFIAIHGKCTLMNNQDSFVPNIENEISCVTMTSVRFNRLVNVQRLSGIITTLSHDKTTSEHRIYTMMTSPLCRARRGKIDVPPYNTMYKTDDEQNLHIIASAIKMYQSKLRTTLIPFMTVIMLYLVGNSFNIV